MSPLVVLTRDDLLEVIATALRSHDEERNKGVTCAAEGLSGYRAAKLAHKRREDVATAMKSGALRAQRNGRRWITTAADVHEWIRGGCKLGSSAR